MLLQLSNFHDDTTITLEVPGNPLLTYDELRLGDGTPSETPGDASTFARFDSDLQRWIITTGPHAGARFTDIEILTTS